MAKEYITPGIYVEEISKLPPTIASVETAIPAFIGYTEKADNLTPDDLKLKPVRISSLLEYTEFFGGPQKEEGITITINETQVNGVTTDLKPVASLSESAKSKHTMFNSLQMFFANGGGPCWIVSVGKYKRIPRALPGKTALLAGLNRLKTIDEVTLIVFPEAQNLSITGFKSLHDAALRQCNTLKDRFVIMDVHGGNESLSNPGSNLHNVILNFRTNGIGSNNLKFGAAYFPNIETVLDYACDETKTEVNIVRNGIAVPSVKLDTLKDADLSKYEIAKKAINDLPCTLPPSGAIAGVYASVDNTRGVWKAPANVSLNAVIKPIMQITNADQEEMNLDSVNGKSVNAIRIFTGKGTLVWGARTLAGNDNEWRYVNVRRLFNFVEESVKKGTEQFVFEPNDANTWVRVQAMIEDFLTTLWRQGALQGNKPNEAFFAAVGLGKTMTANDILEGRMIVEIGMAAVRPAEFIILRFMHKMVSS
jgi:uncharacterized protein